MGAKVDGFLREAATWIWLGMAGLMGRVLYHAKQVQAGVRKPWSTALLWDIPIGLGMGWIALGGTTYLGLTQQASVSVAMIFSYLGPYTMDRLLTKWMDFKFPKGKPNDAD